MAKHDMKLVRTDEGYCGDHYCTGHGRTELVCSCGHKERVYDIGLGSNDFEQKKVAHVLKAEGLMN